MIKRQQLKIGKEGENRYKFTKTNNIKKLEREIKLIQRRLSNIRLNHIHQTTTAIVKTKPSRIVVEDLNVQGMLKNKHLSKAIQEQCFHKFISILEYKSKFNSIEFVKADRFYPSSKTCSCCGAIKKDLKLKDRIFVCPSCNSSIDRDKNASINLSRYKKSATKLCDGCNQYDYIKPLTKEEIKEKYYGRKDKEVMVVSSYGYYFKKI